MKVIDLIQDRTQLSRQKINCKGAQQLGIRVCQTMNIIQAYTATRPHRSRPDRKALDAGLGYRRGVDPLTSSLSDDWKIKMSDRSNHRLNNNESQNTDPWYGPPRIRADTSWGDDPAQFIGQTGDHLAQSNSSLMLDDLVSKIIDDPDGSFTAGQLRQGDDYSSLSNIWSNRLPSQPTQLQYHPTNYPPTNYSAPHTAANYSASHAEVNYSSPQAATNLSAPQTGSYDPFTYGYDGGVYENIKTTAFDQFGRRSREELRLSESSIYTDRSTPEDQQFWFPDQVASSPSSDHQSVKSGEMRKIVGRSERKHDRDYSGDSFEEPPILTNRSRSPDNSNMDWNGSRRPQNLPLYMTNKAQEDNFSLPISVNTQSQSAGRGYPTTLTEYEQQFMQQVNLQKLPMSPLASPAAHSAHPSSPGHVGSGSPAARVGSPAGHIGSPSGHTGSPMFKAPGCPHSTAVQIPSPYQQNPVRYGQISQLHRQTLHHLSHQDQKSPDINTSPTSPHPSHSSPHSNTPTSQNVYIPYSHQTSPRYDSPRFVGGDSPRFMSGDSPRYLSADSPRFMGGDSPGSEGRRYGLGESSDMSTYRALSPLHFQQQRIGYVPALVYGSRGEMMYEMIPISPQFIQSGGNKSSPQNYHYRNIRRTGAANDLHINLETAYEQFKMLEKERKKTEGEMARQNPGKHITSENNTLIPHLTSNPSRVDRLIMDSFKEHSRVMTLINKMEVLLNEETDLNTITTHENTTPAVSEQSEENQTKLHPNIITCLDCWSDSIKKVQNRRKEEIVNATNRHRSATPRPHDDKDVIALASAISELALTTRRARSALWSALQVVWKDGFIPLGVVSKRAELAARQQIAARHTDGTVDRISCRDTQVLADTSKQLEPITLTEDLLSNVFINGLKSLVKKPDSDPNNNPK